MKTEAPPVPAAPVSDGEITLENRLPPGHRYRAVMDEVVRIALRGLPGSWDVSACSVGRTLFRTDVGSPGGASWSISVPVYEGPTAGDLAAAVRAACLRHCGLRFDNGKAGSSRASAGSDGERDHGTSAASQMTRVAREPSPLAPEGMHK